VFICWQSLPKLPLMNRTGSIQIEVGLFQMARVLIVEDDADIRALVARRVQAAGHSVIECEDAESALATLGDRKVPEVAILDISLPGMDGMELLSELRAMLGQPDFPAIFLTARVNHEDVERGRAMGCQYLTKPVIFTALLGSIDRVAPTSGGRGW
jgi:DNA-binding response OmpR family regulator